MKRGFPELLWNTTGRCSSNSYFAPNFAKRSEYEYTQLLHPTFVVDEVGKQFWGLATSAAFPRIRSSYSVQDIIN